METPEVILNLGCGMFPLKSTDKKHIINVDMLKHPLVIKHNITKFPYPLESNKFDKVYFFHTIEHIPEGLHRHVLTEIFRLLKPGGTLAISYPEFKVLAKFYIDNYNNDRQFWRRAIYGRGLTQWDFHKALMDTEYFVEHLKDCGLWPTSIKSERRESWNTIILAEKREKRISYESLMGEEFNLERNE